jgi:TPR repeat protein
MLAITAAFNVFSQNEMIAKIEYEEAENSINQENYVDGYKRLLKVEEMLQKWSPNISYLKIKCLDKIFNVTDIEDKYTSELIKEMDRYMKYSNDNRELVVMEKFKEVYEISKKTEYCKRNSLYQKDQLMLDADKLYNNKNYESAISLYKKSAEKGNCISMSSIGDIYKWYYVNINMEEASAGTIALDWYKKAVDCGSLSANYKLGVAYRWGFLNLKVDYQKAFKYFTYAKDFGYSDAITELGELYYFGKGVPENYEMSYKLMKRAADLNDADGIYWVGNHYRYGNFVKKDYLNALEYYKKAALQGQTDAMEEIGNMYDVGLGVTRDKKEAVNWFTMAANSDKASSMIKLFELLKGDKNITNLKSAADWYQRAIELGIKENDLNDYKNSFYVLGSFYENVLKNHPNALKWYLKGAEKNNPYAMERVVYLYKKGNPFVRNKQLAKSWSQKYKKVK